MANDIAVTPGSGAQVSTEEVTTLNGATVSAKHVQRVGSTFITSDHVAVDAATGAGDVSPAVPRFTLADNDPAVVALNSLVAGQADTSDSNVEPHAPGDLVTVTPTLDTSGPYAVGDVLFPAKSFVAMRANDLRSQLQSLVLIDLENQKPGIKFKFYSAAVTYGTANAAPSISDIDQANFLGPVDIAPTDWDSDGTLNATAAAKNIGLMLESVAGQSNVYVVGKVTSGTPTYTATNSLILRIGVWFQ